jgi:hypothetical protein
MGRPTKLTPEVLERVETALRLGAAHNLAAKCGGFSQATWSSWMARARDDYVQGVEPGFGPKQSPYLAFLEAVEKAEGEGAATWLAIIERAAKEGVWQAAAWKLERRYPELYGRRISQVDATVSIRRSPLEEWEGNGAGNGARSLGPFVAAAFVEGPEEEPEGD